MGQFPVLLKKELLEMARSFKLIWLPLVYVLLGISDAIMNYFMEDILGSVGNLPEGMEIIIPEFSPEDIYIATMGQFQLIGLIIVVAIVAGSISRERQFGLATLLYVRPLAYRSYFLSKWVAYCGLVIFSVVLGFAGSFYYTTLLYGSVDFTKLLVVVVLYSIWMIFVVTVVMFLSAAFSTAVALTIGMVVFPIFTMVQSLIGAYWTISPSKLAIYAAKQLTEQVELSHIIFSSLFTLLLIGLAIGAGIVMSKKRASTTQI